MPKIREVIPVGSGGRSAASCAVGSGDAARVPGSAASSVMIQRPSSGQRNNDGWCVLRLLWRWEKVMPSVLWRTNSVLGGEKIMPSLSIFAPRPLGAR